MVKLLLDREDTERVALRKWHFNGCGYLVTSVNHGSQVLLHHYLIGRPLYGLEVDHINRNKLDNRKANLRFVTHSENQRNKPLRGCVSYRKERGTWRVVILGKYYGEYKSKSEANLKNLSLVRKMDSQRQVRG
jgi:hypothetical protein